ncbi:MAG: hypothetical protein RR061_06450 [Muribaculaceae bacterium]
MQTKKNRIIALFFTLLFVTYYGNISLFQHTHIVNNVPITHSHPYSPESHHSHSASSLIAFSLLSNLIVTSVILGIALSAFRYLILIIKIVNDRVCNIFKTRRLSTRAPPILAIN